MRFQGVQRRSISVPGGLTGPRGRFMRFQGILGTFQGFFRDLTDLGSIPWGFSGFHAYSIEYQRISIALNLSRMFKERSRDFQGIYGEF